MPTFLFDEIIFGPVRSRRLGVSLGINLSPVNMKLCNFDCIYCECGRTMKGKAKGAMLPSRKAVFEALDAKLAAMKKKGEAPDVITFAGNGEPTMHPDFPGIIDDSIRLRNKYFPEAKVAVLSNSTAISRPDIRQALMKVDQNILKLDSALDKTIKIHNRPNMNIRAEELIKNLQQFGGRLIIQTLFLRGTFKGRKIDNTTPEEIDAWLKAIEKINPAEVMIYTISRDTPEGGDLKKVPVADLKHIAFLVSKLGIKTQVSG